jgi:hypothetical protein
MPARLALGAIELATANIPVSDILTFDNTRSPRRGTAS